ncbi:uncharacterized protein METZ01_LOCUS174732, partial [marine metagenome]
MNSGTILDGAGNPANLTLAAPAAANSLGANKAIIIDSATPTISAVTSTTADGSYNAGDIIIITINFSEPVYVSGTPQLTLETGDTSAAVAEYSSGSGDTTLTFSYTIASGDNSNDLGYASTSALALNSGTILDGAGNPANLTLAEPGAIKSLSISKSLIIDTTNPIVSSVTEGSAISTSGNDVDYQNFADTLVISWSGSDSGSGISTYEYALGTTTGATDAITWTSAATATADTLTGLSLTEGTTYYLSVRATDAAGNMSSVSTADGITIDLTAPSGTTVSDGTGGDITYSSSDSILSANWAAFTETVSGIQKYEYAIGDTIGGTNVVTWTDNDTSTSVIKSGLTLTSGSIYYINVRAIDNAGNIANVITSDGAMVDTAAPISGSVTDSTAADLDWTKSSSTLTATWMGFSDTLSGIQKYEYAIGDTIGGTNVLSWTDNSTTT